MRQFIDWFTEEVAVKKGVWTILWVIAWLSFFRAFFNIGEYLIG